MNREAERKRLVELIGSIRLTCEENLSTILCAGCEYCKFDYPNCRDVRLADYLLADGWMRPPCKVGDTVWYLNKHPHITLLQNSVYKAEVVRLVTISTGTVIVIQIKSEGCCEIPDETDWGITVFPTREEAEQALKGGAGK